MTPLKANVKEINKKVLTLKEVLQNKFLKMFSPFLAT